MRLLVTGANGYIGSILVRLVSRPLVTLDCVGPATIVADIAAMPAGDWQHEISHVVHLADLRLPDFHSDQDVDRNVQKHRSFFNSLKSWRGLQKVVFASSCSVYGANDSEIGEDSPVNPTSHYAISKLAIEEFVRELDCDYTIARFGTAYGLSDAFREDLFVNQLAMSVRSGEEFELFGAEAWRPYVHTQDFARALDLLLNTSGVPLVNVVESNYTKKMIVAEIDEIAPGRLRYSIDPTKPDPRNYFVGNTKVTGLGFQFSVPFNSGLSELVGTYATSN